MRQSIVPWVNDLVQRLAVSHQPDHAIAREAVEEAVGKVSVRLHDSSMGRGEGPVRDLKNKVLVDNCDGSRERSRSVARAAASSGGWAPAPESAAPVVDDDDMLPISFEDAIADAILPPGVEERPTLELGIDLPEPWLNGDELNKMDDEQIRGYVRRVMKGRARREIAKAMSGWGIHDSKHAHDLWGSYEQAVGWISPRKWKPVLESKEAWNGMISGTVAVMKAHFHAFWGMDASIADRKLWEGLAPHHSVLKTHIQMLVSHSDPACLRHANHEDLINDYGIEKLYESVPRRRSAS